MFVRLCALFGLAVTYAWSGVLVLCWTVRCVAVEEAGVDIYRDEHVERGLRCYVETVARGLGVEAAASVCEWSPPANAYIALTERLPSFSARDFALIWDEIHGWAATVETGSGEDLVVLAYLLGDVLPAPAEVIEFARDMLAGRYPRHPAGMTHHPGRSRTARSRHVRLGQRLVLYAEPAETGPSPMTSHPGGLPSTEAGPAPSPIR